MLQKQGADDKKNVTERLKGVWCLKAMTCDERGLVRDQVSSKGNPPPFKQLGIQQGYGQHTETERHTELHETIQFLMILKRCTEHTIIEIVRRTDNSYSEFEV